MRSQSCGSDMGRSACYSTTCVFARSSVAKVWLCSALISIPYYYYLCRHISITHHRLCNRQCRLGPWHLSHLVQDLGGEPQVTHYEHVRNFGEPQGVLVRNSLHATHSWDRRLQRSPAFVRSVTGLHARFQDCWT